MRGFLLTLGVLAMVGVVLGVTSAVSDIQYIFAGICLTAACAAFAGAEVAGIRQLLMNRGEPPQLEPEHLDVSPSGIVR